MFFIKKCFDMEVIMKTFLIEKTFFTEKKINGNVKYIYIYLISNICFYTENVCVANKI